MFLPYKISTYRSIDTSIRGTVVSNFSLLNSDVPAMVYKKSSNSLRDWQLWRNTDYVYYDVITNDLDVKVWDQVNIWLSSNIQEDWFIVDSIDVNYTKITWTIDNVYFLIKKHYG